MDDDYDEEGLICFTCSEPKEAWFVCSEPREACFVLSVPSPGGLSVCSFRHAHPVSEMNHDDDEQFLLSYWIYNQNHSATSFSVDHATLIVVY